MNWGSVDIRRFTFLQSAGPHNVLGVVKFMFPNKHDIYMHDTPQRELFERPVRTFSHGCIRVHNPGRLAELMLAEDKGWPAEQVRGLLAQGYNNEVPLQRQIPVHVTYFTAVAGEDGQVSYFGDIYGHDNRVLAALGGKAAAARRRRPATANSARRAGRSEIQAEQQRFLLRPVRQLRKVGGEDCRLRDDACVGYPRRSGAVPRSCAGVGDGDDRLGPGKQGPVHGAVVATLRSRAIRGRCGHAWLRRPPQRQGQAQSP